MGSLPPLLLLISSLSLLLSLSGAELSQKLGVCYGQLGNNLPPPRTSLHLLNHLKAKRVKLYDANPQILNSLKHTHLQVTIMVPNNLLLNISKNQTLSNQWVKTNVSPFYPHVKIQYLLVGNEILSSTDNSTHLSLVPAMRRIRLSLKCFGLKNIKVGTPLAMDVLELSFPPSSGTFRSEFTAPVLIPLLRFLNRTKSLFFLDVYPYFAWASDPVNIKLGYALLKAKHINYTDPGTGLTYHNLLDQMLDAVFFAMKRLGYPDLRLFIAETGWPNGGDADQIGASPYNAAAYNRHVVRKLTAKPPAGTPARPGTVIPAFLFALYNENKKPGQGTERHFGLLYPNGSGVYPIDLSGKTRLRNYPPLPGPANNEPKKKKMWCVVVKGANLTAVGEALGYACGQGNGTCDPIQPGGKCFEPDSLVWHASYAFSSYWAQFKQVGGTCDFNGVAEQTKVDPSYGSCKYPSVTF